jgi:hypothetical protein
MTHEVLNPGKPRADADVFGALPAATPLNGLVNRSLPE